MPRPSGCRNGRGKPRRQAHDLWEKGDKAGAKTMSERGKELDAQAKKLHDQAAHAIYLHRNGGRPDN